MSDGHQRVRHNVHQPANRPRKLRFVRKRLRRHAGVQRGRVRRDDVRAGLDDVRRPLRESARGLVELRRLWDVLRADGRVYGGGVHVSVDRDPMRDGLHQHSDRSQPLRRLRQRVPGRARLRDGTMRSIVDVPDGNDLVRRPLHVDQRRPSQLRHVRACLLRRSVVRRRGVLVVGELRSAPLDVRSELRGSSNRPGELRYVRAALRRGRRLCRGRLLVLERPNALRGRGVRQPRDQRRPLWGVRHRVWGRSRVHGQSVRRRRDVSDGHDGVRGLLREHQHRREQLRRVRPSLRRDRGVLERDVRRDLVSGWLHPVRNRVRGHQPRRSPLRRVRRCVSGAAHLREQDVPPRELPGNDVRLALH